MSLQGSLQTVALPEVLGFLSSTGKSGELTVNGPASTGKLWFREGLLCGFQVERGPNPAEAVFQLLRFDEGEFCFAAGAEQPDEADRVDREDGPVPGILERAQQQLAEWHGIVAVVPSLDHRVHLSDDISHDTVALDRPQWKLVVAIGEGHPVGEVITARGLGEFEGCRAVKDLVEAGLAHVAEPAQAGEEAPAAEQPAVAPGWGAAGPFDVLGTGLAALNGEAPAPGGTADAEQSSWSHAAEAPAPAAAPFVNGWFSGEAEAGAPAAFGMPDGDEAPPAAAADTPPAPDHEESPVPTSSRDALQALIEEVSAEVADEPPAASEEGVDGLADRGPWTHHELEQMNGWADDDRVSAGSSPDGEVAAPAFHAVPAPDAPVATYVAEDPGTYGEHQAFGDYPAYSEHQELTEQPAEDEAQAEAEEDPAPVEEPINRGLLLKFLSSVRN